LVAEQVALGEHQQNNAVVALTQATKENYLVGEGVVAGVQAREKALALANLDPKERKSMVKDAVAEYDDAVKQLREYVTTTA
jgi:Na+/phosphate symporter